MSDRFRAFFRRHGVMLLEKVWAMPAHQKELLRRAIREGDGLVREYPGGRWAPVGYEFKAGKRMKWFVLGNVVRSLKDKGHIEQIKPGPYAVYQVTDQGREAAA